MISKIVVVIGIILYIAGAYYIYNTYELIVGEMIPFFKAISSNVTIDLYNISSAELINDTLKIDAYIILKFGSPEGKGLKGPDVSILIGDIEIVNTTVEELYGEYRIPIRKSIDLNNILESELYMSIYEVLSSFKLYMKAPMNVTSSDYIGYVFSKAYDKAVDTKIFIGSDNIVLKIKLRTEGIKIRSRLDVTVYDVNGNKLGHNTTNVELYNVGDECLVVVKINPSDVNKVKYIEISVPLKQGDLVLKKLILKG